MEDALRQNIERVNAHFAVLLEGAQRALRGECGFDVGDVRRLREILREMVPIVARSSELRRKRPEIGGQLDRYKSQLGELQTTLVQLRVMLHGHQVRLQASQSHHTAVSRWVSAFRQTR